MTEHLAIRPVGSLLIIIVDKVMMMSADKGAIAGAENAAPANDKHLIELNLIGDGL